MICGRWKVLGRLKHFRDGPLNILVLILTPCRPFIQDFSNFSIAEILKILPFLAPWPIWPHCDSKMTYWYWISLVVHLAMC